MKEIRPRAESIAGGAKLFFFLALASCRTAGESRLPLETEREDRGVSANAVQHARIFMTSLEHVQQRLNELLEGGVQSIELWVPASQVDSYAYHEASAIVGDKLYGPISWRPADLIAYPGFIDAVGIVALFTRRPHDLFRMTPDNYEAASGMLWEAGIPFQWDEINLFWLVVDEAWKTAAEGVLSAFVPSED